MTLGCAVAALSACGGGGSSGTPPETASSSGGSADGNAWTLVGIKPAHASQTVSGNVYMSTQEWINDLMLTNGSPYNYQTIYSVTIPNVQSTDVVECNAQAEVTNPYQYNVQVNRVIAYGTVADSYPVTPQPPTTGNVTPDMHHMPINWTWLDSGSSGTVTYSLDLAAASTSADTGSYLTVEPGYGYIKCHVMAS